MSVVAALSSPGLFSKSRTADKTTSMSVVKEASDEPMRTVDDLVRQRARMLGDKIVLSYPSSGISYVDYSMRQLDIFAYRVARHYEPQLPVRTSSDEKPLVVAMLGPSNLEYLVTILAMMKLGHTILFLSTRISQEAVASLMKTTHAGAILFDARYAETAAGAVQASAQSWQLLEIASRTTFELGIDDVPSNSDTRLDRELDHAVETHNHVYIIHSSGSTGFPKPIYQTHKAALVNYSSSMELRAFITLPLYHNHGICNLFRAVYCGQSIHLYNAELPLTTGHLEAILAKHKFEIFYGVPYALKLLAESPTGIELLRQLKVVMYGGSACPDELGDMLVEAGVNLIGHYGATEVGQLMTSARPAGDKLWNYVRETDKLTPFLNWIPRGSNLFECCVRDGWPAKLTSNMPDGSYATKDLFEPHSTLPRAWKYIARQDDTVALVNGEKFSPVALEGRIRSDSWVTEAVVFGAGKPYIGLLLVPAPTTAGLSWEAVLDHLWPVIEAANHQSEAYGCLSRNMIIVLPHDTVYPRTDKGSIIRQAFYRMYATEIETAYAAADEATAGENGQSTQKTMKLDEIKAFLREQLPVVLGKGKTPTGADDEVDFFALGMDSLQSIRLRQEIVHSIDVGGYRLGSNVVFDYPSVTKLSCYLHSLQTGAEAKAVSVEAEMGALVDKYAALDIAIPQRPRTSVVVTGATGSLGAHVAARLTADPSVERVYCLVRAGDDATATRRLLHSLTERRVLHALTWSQRQKLRALSFDQSARLLGLSEATYWEVAGRLRAVIHCAWSVNFNLRLSSFERDCIAGVQHLLALCVAAASGTTGPATFAFCSSVSSVARCPTVHVPETLTELTWAQGMGYAQSKAVAEHLCIRAATTHGVPARVLRVGQIIADTRFGIWNTTEAIPLILQSALTIGALPRLRENPAWLPVDTVAQAVLEISLADDASADKGIVTNVANRRSFDWTDDLLPALRAAGLLFEEVEPREWVRRLRANPDPVANPPVKLAGFFAAKYDRDDFAPSKTYATDVACHLSPALAAAPVLDPAVVARFVRRFQTVWAAQAERETTDAQSQKRTKKAKTVVVLAGPCGSGKSSIGDRLVRALGGTLVEGDSLHTRDAVARMASGSALSDDDRWAWLARIRSHARSAAFTLGYDLVVVTCSALHRSYRDALRKLREPENSSSSPEEDGPVHVLFVDLQAPAEVLFKRVSHRKDHYMPAVMVDSQVREHEAIEEDEEDVIPIDADGTLEQVFQSVHWAVSSVL